MRPALALFCLLLVLPACAEEQPIRPTTLLASARLPGPAHDALEVLVYDIPAGTVLEDVRLIGPDGERLSATQVGRGTSESGPGLVSRPLIGIGVSGGSSSGINPSIGVGWGLTGGGPSRQSRQATYLVALPPDIAYPVERRGWHIDVHYLDVTGTQQVRTIPAPWPE